jgi:PAS domain S-box-containing protein
MPQGHLPVRSYLAASVRSRTGAVLGGLFFGHSQPAMFTARAERLLGSVAAQAAIALDNAQLYQQTKRAQAAAEIERARLRTLLMQAPVAVAVWRGPNLVYELANPRYETLVRRTGLVGTSLVDVFPELAGQPILTTIRGVLETGEPFSTPEEAIDLDRGNGRPERCWFAFSLEPIREPDGSISGVLCVAIDVTDQVNARDSLDQARRQAEAASRAKDEFLAILGHELRNPLAPILTGLQLMRLRGDRSSEREREVIERQVTHVVRLVDDLLDVSRITRGKVELRRRPVELCEVVAKGIEMSSPLIEERRQRLGVDVPREGLVVDGDLSRLAQVVSNLLTNAAKYSEPGSVVRVSARAAGGAVTLSVRDEGVGLAPDMLDRVFELFVQEPQSLERSRGGLGLGLTIVKNLVAQHGGTIEARSEGRGRGTEFVVTLPLASAAAPSTGGEVVPRGQATEHPRGRAILVVDDNHDAADLLADALRAQDHRVSVAYDGPSALATARGSRPEIALLDIGLPVMDGYELARRLRDLPGSSSLRLVAVTGYGQEADRQRAGAAGFDEHQTKPINLDDLARVIAKLR